MNREKNIRFSIIIPTYNSEKYIAQCLKSIAKLNYPKEQYEIIVVDSGSKDNTLKIAQGLKSHCVRICHSKNISISYSRNVGAEMARGIYLVFIDSDCYVNMSLLEKAEKYLKRYECYGSFYKSYAKHGWIAKTWLIAEEKKSGIVKWVTSGTLIVRKNIFFMINGFNEEMETEEDEDFGRRLRKKGGRIYNDLSMGSVHLGQANSLRQFFLKEMWRGKSIIKPIRNRQKKYSKFDLAILLHFACMCFLIFTMFTGALYLFTAVSGIFLIPLIFTIKNIRNIKSPIFGARMYILHFIFLIARSISIVRYNQIKNLVK